MGTITSKLDREYTAQMSRVHFKCTRLSHVYVHIYVRTQSAHASSTYQG